MSRAAWALLLALAAPSSALDSHSAVARRGDFPVRVRVEGRVAAAGVFRLKSTIEGRVIAVTADTFTWVSDGEPLGMLADKELGAILDAHGTTGSDILEERWQRIYRPTRISCPQDCFVLKRFIRVRQSIKPEAILFEAARGLRLEGRVGLEYAHLLKRGLSVEFWTAADPVRKTVKIGGTRLDLNGDRGKPGGEFWADLSPRASLNPGTAWEGIVVAETKRNTLHVPTKALIRSGGAVYLPVKVSTGVTTEDTAEIISGVEDGRPILIPDENRLGDACPHRAEPDLNALCHQLLNAPRKTQTAPNEVPEPTSRRKSPSKKEEQPKPKKEEPERDPSWGPDPYEE